MTLSAAALRKMLELGLTADQMVELAEVLEHDLKRAAPAVDEQADRRRRADRERKRVRRNSAEMSADNSADTSAETPLLDKEIPPTPPKEINPTPADASSERASESVWAERLAEAKAIGAGLDLTVPAMHVHRDLRLLVEPEVGTPCTWPEVLDAIRIEAAKAKTRGKPIRSWSWVKDTAIGLRDRRLNGLPPVEQSHGRQQSPPTGHPRTSHQLEKLADVDAAMRAAVRG